MICFIVELPVLSESFVGWERGAFPVEVRSSAARHFETMKATQSFELKGMKKSLVKPFYKTEHPDRLKPALWDLLYIDSYVPVIFFYRPETDGSATSSSSRPLQFSERVAHLKDSLSKVLVHQYPFAGRWRKTYDETVRELLCNDEGVPFFEAQIDEEMDTVIGDADDFRPVPALGNFNLVGLNNLWFQQDVDFPMPPIFFQVPDFISIDLGFHTRHSLHQPNAPSLVARTCK